MDLFMPCTYYFDTTVAIIKVYLPLLVALSNVEFNLLGDNCAPWTAEEDRPKVDFLGVHA